MRKELIVNPIGIKGDEINERIKSLMGVSNIQENNKKNSVVELSKLGPDGKVYGIVRENHEYYIKSTDKKENVILEDFNYIGGLKNKKSESYPTYAKAIKHLNLKFNSIAESLNSINTINVFQDDKIVKEYGGVSNFKGNGFSGEGNLDHNVSKVEEADNNPWAICTASVGRDDKEKYEACVKGVKKEKGLEENKTIDRDEYKNLLSKYDKLTGQYEDLEDSDDKNKKDLLKKEIEKTEKLINSYERDDKTTIKEGKGLSISRALTQMDSIIDSLNEVKKKV